MMTTVKKLVRASLNAYRPICQCPGNQMALIGAPSRSLYKNEPMLCGLSVFCPSPEPGTNCDYRQDKSRRFEWDGMRVRYGF